MRNADLLVITKSMSTEASIIEKLLIEFLVYYQLNSISVGKTSNQIKIQIRFRVPY